ncbi:MULTISPECIES: type III effector HrpK domain-containing protein [unclassified Sphingobium]|uniref:type III effector HrpK domain-containing protein n=1 Tax=unclassified Sphingobium TaxID=2611147 RepID=UPI0035A72B10
MPVDKLSRADNIMSFQDKIEWAGLLKRAGTATHDQLAEKGTKSKHSTPATASDRTAHPAPGDKLVENKNVSFISDGHADVRPSDIKRDEQRTPIENVHASRDAYLEKNPDADPMSKDIVNNADYILENWDAISGGQDEITADDLTAYVDANPDLSQDARDALKFWSQPGMWEQLDNGGDNPALVKDDGIVVKKNVEDWIENEAPTNALQFSNFLDQAAFQALGDRADLAGIEADIFVNPEKYTHEQRAAVAVELMNARNAIEAGIQSGLWGDAKSQVWVSANTGANPDSNKVLAEINDKISILINSDGMQDHLRSAKEAELQNIVDADPSVKEALQSYYDDKILTGDGLNDLLNLKDANGDPLSLPAALDTFMTNSETLSSALGLDAPNFREVVTASGRMGDLEQYYRDTIVTGEGLKDMLASGMDPTIAMATYGEQVARLNAVVDPGLAERSRDEMMVNFGQVVHDSMLDQVSFENLKAVFGNPDGTLNENLVRDVLTQLYQKNPELFVNDDKPMTVDEALGGVRAAWDSVRQGAKVTDAFGKLGFLNAPGNDVQKAYGSGAMHIVSGLFMGSMAIARGASFKPGSMDANSIVPIVTGAVATSGLLLEGGAKGKIDNVDHAKNQYLKGDRPEAWLKDMIKREVADHIYYLKKFETAGKFLGGSANIVAGVFGIISGTSDLNKGNTAIGAIKITGGSLSLFAGGTTVAEAILTIVGAPARVIASAASLAGIAGGAAAAFGIGVLVGVQIWQEVKTEKALDQFSDTINAYLDQWQIDGGPTEDKDYTFVPEETVGGS